MVQKTGSTSYIFIRALSSGGVGLLEDPSQSNQRCRIFASICGDDDLFNGLVLCSIRCKPDARIIENLKLCRRVRHLDISSSVASDEMVRVACSLPSLKYLSVADTTISTKSLQYIDNSNITDCDLRMCAMIDARAVSELVSRTHLLVVRCGPFSREEEDDIVAASRENASLVKIVFYREGESRELRSGLTIEYSKAGLRGLSELLHAGRDNVSGGRPDKAPPLDEK